MSERKGDNEEPTSSPDEQVDLGSDLLSSQPEKPQGTIQVNLDDDRADNLERVESVEELLNDAEILVNERIYEEAKKILYRIMRIHANYVPARNLLKDIHELELKTIFSDESARMLKTDYAALMEEKTDDLVDRLDDELDLGFKKETEGLEDFKLTILDGRNEHRGVPVSGLLKPRELVDLGIAFYEMGLHSMVVKELQRLPEVNYDDPDEAKITVAGLTLFAMSLIKLGRLFEAKIVLEKVIASSSTISDDRIDVLYLLGRISQQLKNWDDARAWYEQVTDIDPHFKDARLRLRKGLDGA